MNAPLLSLHDGPVARLRMNRPTLHNAFDAGLIAALAWLLLLRPYGFQLEDEGTLLSWFDRVARGQRARVRQIDGGRRGHRHSRGRVTGAGVAAKR